MRALLFGISGNRGRRTTAAGELFSLGTKAGLFGAAGKPPTATD
jgi:hypothetical protein